MNGDTSNIFVPSCDARPIPAWGAPEQTPGVRTPGASFFLRPLLFRLISGKAGILEPRPQPVRAELGRNQQLVKRLHVRKPELRDLIAGEDGQEKPQLAF